MKRVRSICGLFALQKGYIAIKSFYLFETYYDNAVSIAFMTYETKFDFQEAF